MQNLGFGIFHTTIERNRDVFYKIADCDYVNSIIIECDYRSEEFKETFSALMERPDKQAWISVTTLGFRTTAVTSVADIGEDKGAFNPVTEMLDEYRENIDRFISFIKEKGWYGKITGFYMDEPMLWNITNDQLEAFTGYFRTVAAADKRFFICFSVAEVAPEYWTINDIRPITPKSVQHLTDIAFDMYHPWSDEYRQITDIMLERAGNRSDLKLWFIPCTMDYRGDKTEQHCLDHLDGCLAALRQSQNPGGLMCFTYYTFKPEEEALGNVGLDKLTDPSYKKHWRRLEERIKQIGKELVSG